MAILLDQITVGELAVHVLDSDPRTGGGFSATIGVMALVYNSGSPVGEMYIKTGAGNTDWERVSTTASSGTINAGDAGRLSLYPASGNTLDDVYVQNSQNIAVAITAQPSRSAPITYSIPNPGDAITAASVVLTEGATTINGALTLTSPLAMSGQNITGLANPLGAQDAATKFYVDSASQGLSWKNSARAATTAAITLSGAQTIDGVSVIAGDRVLVKDQGSSIANGIYVAAVGAWARASDMDGGIEAIGAAVFVEEGTINGDTAWVQVTDAPATIGTDPLVFTQFAGAGTYTAGNGLSLTGTQFSVNQDGQGLDFSGGQLIIELDSVGYATLSKSSAGLRVASGGIRDAEIAAAGTANIARSKLASGSNNHVLINDGSGVMSSEAQLALSRGGTNASLTAVAGGIVYSDASAFAISSAGTTGQPLLSGGTGAPTWFTGTGVVKATSGILSVSNIDLTSEVTGVLPIANGGTNSSAALNNNRLMISSSGAIIEHSALTQGQIIFPNSSGLPAGSANLFWDISNSRLGVGTNAPSQPLHVVGNALLGTGSAFLHQAVTGIAWREQQATVDTTDATVTTLDTFTVPLDTVVLVEFRVIGRRTGGSGGSAGDSSAYVRTARVRNVGGTLSILNLQSDYTSESAGSTNCTINVSGSDLRVRVTGQANANYSWFSHAKILNG